jgi:predicted polyphosphate/ATP-dependent NAD kinase
VSGAVTVGVIANPASGRDIRRLVAGASVFGNADKAGMVFRLLAGLGAAGIERVLMLPAADGLSVTLRRHLHARHAVPAFAAAGPFPELEELDVELEGTARDSAVAVARMVAAGVRAIAVLGGDGTHRVVARGCGEVPLCALSTGTNNAFPEMRETTVAGIATGLVATGRAGDGALRREAALQVEMPDGATDLALVDVAVTRERFIGARALWRADDVSELFVTFASPSAVGLSAVAGAL